MKFIFKIKSTANKQQTKSKQTDSKQTDSKQTDSKQMNYFYDILSFDIQNYIFEIIENDAAKTIQKTWRGTKTRWNEAFTFLIDYITSCDYSADGEIHIGWKVLDPTEEDTCRIIEYCAKNCSSPSQCEYWRGFINNIENGLWDHEYDIMGDKNKQFFKRVHYAMAAIVFKVRPKSFDNEDYTGLPDDDKIKLWLNIWKKRYSWNLIAYISALEPLV